MWGLIAILGLLAAEGAWDQEWETKDFRLQYRVLESGDLLLFAERKKGSRAPRMNLQELVRYFLDLELAQVDSEEAHRKWKAQRALLMGAILAHKRRDVGRLLSGPDLKTLKTEIEIEESQVNREFYLFEQAQKNWLSSVRK